MSLAAWTALPINARTRFAGQDQVIELIVTSAEPTWSEEAITFEKSYVDEAPVMVRPTSVTIARRSFSHSPVRSYSEQAFAAIMPEVLQVNSELDVPRADSDESVPAFLASADEPPVIQRQHVEPRPLQAAAVQPPQQAGNERTAPIFTTSPPPSYPTVAIQNRWQGTTLLRVFIDATGAVLKAEVARTSGHTVLDGAAVNAVKRWKGSPATRFGRPVPTTELLPVRFNLGE